VDLADDVAASSTTGEPDAPGTTSSSSRSWAGDASTTVPAVVAGRAAGKPTSRTSSPTATGRSTSRNAGGSAPGSATEHRDVGDVADLDLDDPGVRGAVQGPDRDLPGAVDHVTVGDDDGAVPDVDHEPAAAPALAGRAPGRGRAGSRRRRRRRPACPRGSRRRRHRCVGSRARPAARRPWGSAARPRPPPPATAWRDRPAATSRSRPREVVLVDRARPLLVTGTAGRGRPAPRTRRLDPQAAAVRLGHPPADVQPQRHPRGRREPVRRRPRTSARAPRRRRPRRERGRLTWIGRRSTVTRTAVPAGLDRTACRSRLNSTCRSRTGSASTVTGSSGSASSTGGRPRRSRRGPRRDRGRGRRGRAAPVEPEVRRVGAAVAEALHQQHRDLEVLADPRGERPDGLVGVGRAVLEQARVPLGDRQRVEQLVGEVGQPRVELLGCRVLPTGHRPASSSAWVSESATGTPARSSSSRGCEPPS
jgi:hypothetical protein